MTQMVLDKNMKKNKSTFSQNGKNMKTYKRPPVDLKSKPAKIPTHLARSAVFKPTRKIQKEAVLHKKFQLGKWTDITFIGPQLGISHKDALISIFRMKPEILDDLNKTEILYITDEIAENKSTTDNIDEIQKRQKEAINKFGEQAKKSYVITTSWRKLLKSQGLSEDSNNIKVQKRLFEELASITMNFNIDLGKENQAGGAGHILSFLNEGTNLDDKIHFILGAHIKLMLDNKRLVMLLDAKKYFELKSEYAKAFFTFIDSQPNNTWIDESVLAKIAQREIWEEDYNSRSNFRRYCKKAFDDFVRIGYLKNIRRESYKDGKRTCYKFHYDFNNYKQTEMFQASEEELIN